MWHATHEEKVLKETIPKSKSKLKKKISQTERQNKNQQ